MWTVLRSKFTQQKKQDWKYHPYSPLYRLKSSKVLPKVSVHRLTLFQTEHLSRSIPWIVPANQAIQSSLNDYQNFSIIYISIFPIYPLGFQICFLHWWNAEKTLSLIQIWAVPPCENPPCDDDSPLARTCQACLKLPISYK